MERRHEPKVIALLREAAPAFADERFEPALGEALRAEPRLVRPVGPVQRGPALHSGSYVASVETGRYDAGRHHVRSHRDQAAAVADFIQPTASWLAHREVVHVDT